LWEYRPAENWSSWRWWNTYEKLQFLFHMIGEILFAWNGWKGSVWCSTPGWTLNLSWDWTLSNFSCFLGWSSQQDRTPNAELSCQRSQPSAKLCFAKDCEVTGPRECVERKSWEIGAYPKWCIM
jgi:hypothetical protein